MPVCGNYLFFELPKKIVLNPKDGFLATFSFPPHLSHFCVSIASIIKAFVEFCREFLALLSILSLAFYPCLF